MSITKAEFDWGAVRALPENRDLSAEDFEALKAMMIGLGLNPFSRHLTPMRRAGRTQIVTTIDGLRAMAAQTGEFEGSEPTLWAGPDGGWRDLWTERAPPFAAKCAVWRRGFRTACEGVALWSAYAPDRPSGWWGKGPAHMLAKCAEALALRRAFPDVAGLYTREEMEHQEEAPVPQQQKKPAADEAREASRRALWKQHRDLFDQAAALAKGGSSEVAKYLSELPKSLPPKEIRDKDLPEQVRVMREVVQHFRSLQK